MCGLFGYIGEPLDDLAALEQVAEQAGRRGPYAFGFAWRTGSSPFQVYKQVGLLRNCLDTLSRCRGASLVIGHARLATSGDFRQPENNQPLAQHNVALAHNGNVYNWRELTDAYNLDLQTGCDSEAILQLIVRYGGDLTAATAQAVQVVDETSPLALLVGATDHLIAARRGRHPLFLWPFGSGAYFCSRQPHGLARLIEDHTLLDVRADGHFAEVDLCLTG